MDSDGVVCVAPQRAAVLLTEVQRQLMLVNGVARSSGQVVDPDPVVRLYTLDAGCVWLLSELAGDRDLAYGLCDLGLGAPVLGVVRLSVLGAMRGPLGMPVVCDPSFVARQSLSAYAAEAVACGSICD